MNLENIYSKQYYDPNLLSYHSPIRPRRETLEALALYDFKDNADRKIIWTPGQLEIIDCILNRGSQSKMKRIEIIAATQYGKSLAVAAGVVIRASSFPEQWAIVAGTTEKARIIMEHIIMLSLNSLIIRRELDAENALDRLRIRRSIDKLVFRKKGEVRVYSADATRVAETSKSLMGFGSPNVIEDEAALVGDILQATVMRMLGGHKDNFLVKIGNPFNRGHFHRTWVSGTYYRIFIDYQRALDEGRYTKEFIDEMAAEALFDILYSCKFPEEGTIDAKGWLSLLTMSEIERAVIDEDYIMPDRRLGGDIAGGGRNYSVLVLRGYNVAKKIYKENEPDTMAYAGIVVKNARDLEVRDKDIFLDAVGIGRGASDRVREQKAQAQGVQAGSEASESGKFTNLRAEMYWRLREWILQGGKLFRDDDWNQLAEVKYKVDSSGKIKIMSKEEMLREGIDSPDVADSLALTFARPDVPPVLRAQQEAQVSEPEPEMDPYDS